MFDWLLDQATCCSIARMKTWSVILYDFIYYPPFQYKFCAARRFTIALIYSAAHATIKVSWRRNLNFLQIRGVLDNQVDRAPVRKVVLTVLALFLR